MAMLHTCGQMVKASGQLDVSYLGLYRFPNKGDMTHPYVSEISVIYETSKPHAHITTSAWSLNRVYL